MNTLEPRKLPAPISGGENSSDGRTVDRRVGEFVRRHDPTTDAANWLTAIHDHLRAQSEKLSEISERLDSLESKLDGLSPTPAADRIPVNAGMQISLNALDGRSHIGEVLWHLSYRVERLIPIPFAVRKRMVKLFYAPYGKLFPNAPHYRAHVLFHQQQRTLPGVQLDQGEIAAVVPEAAPGRPYDVFIFPVIDWEFRHQRPQHLAELFGRRGHRVFYFTTTFDAGDDYRIAPHAVAENVYIVKLPCTGRLPTIYEDTLTAGQTSAVLRGIDLLRDLFQTTASVSILHHPFWWPVASRLSNNRVVYDCLDHHGGFSNTGARMLELETSLLEGADLVVTTSERLGARQGIYARRSAVIRNGTDYEHFALARPIEPQRRPIVGYYGAIADWFDADLVAAAARALPDCDFVLIGSTAGADLRPLVEVNNVRLTGEIPYRELPAHASAFDVCIIPFRLNELTLNTNPVKVYEYLSMGKPVVSARLPELELLSDHVRIADSVEDFCAHIRAALGENTDAHVERRRAFARQHTWAARIAQFEQAVAPLYPSVSIIVLMHNGLEFTRTCLLSLERLTRYPNWELVLVDNASSDGTADYLQEFARSRDYVRLLRHEQNLGFAAGNNAGARVARGDYLVFLNNDTHVTRGWLGDMVRHFDRRPDLGILNPVTNNIGNEARIDIGYGNMEEMASEAAEFTRGRRGQTLELDVCAFFCVMVPRRVWEDVGELDEQFGMGFFEDDDYARRLKEKGYALACAEDVFVHHHLSASFDALGEERKVRQFERNRQLFEAKWGTWIPHQYRENRRSALAYAPGQALRAVSPVRPSGNQ